MVIESGRARMLLHDISSSFSLPSIPIVVGSCFRPFALSERERGRREEEGRQQNASLGHTCREYAEVKYKYLILSPARFGMSPMVDDIGA